jgi:hypothetical protein
MPPKKNPLGLNPLQLKTLAILQQMARTPRHAEPAGEDGAVRVSDFPPPHGDHYHVGDTVVAGRDMTGLYNPAVFVALARKGLVADPAPGAVTLTPLGLSYDPGPAARAVLHDAHH